MSYTKAQIAQALSTLGIETGEPVTHAKAAALARPVIRNLARQVTLLPRTPGIRSAVDPMTGYTYDPGNALDRKYIRSLNVHYRLFAILHPDAPLWPTQEREERKRAAWVAVHDDGAPLAARINAAQTVLLSHYARSACTSLHECGPLAFAWHPGVCGYAAHYLHASPMLWCERFTSEVFDTLAARYPRPSSLLIDAGRTYWPSPEQVKAGADGAR
jgi:hypothetical protein